MPHKFYKFPLLHTHTRTHACTHARTHAHIHPHTCTLYEEHLKQRHSADHPALTDNQQDEPSPLQLSTVHYKLHLPLAIITLTQAWRTVAIATLEILCNQTCPAAGLQYIWGQAKGFPLDITYNNGCYFDCQEQERTCIM